MKYQNNKIDNETIKETTYRNKEYADDFLEMAKSFKKDAKKVIRKKSHTCKRCCYLTGPVLAGQAFTEWNCGVCDKPFMHSNTNVPVACSDCAEKKDICFICGGEMD